MKARIVILLFLVLAALALVPRAKLTGVVTDQTLKPLPNVTVTAKGTVFSTKTDSLGRYAFNTPSYTRTLVFSLPGYQTREMKLTNGTSLNVQLAPALVQLEEALTPREDVHYEVTPGFIAMSPVQGAYATPMRTHPQTNTENYKAIEENGFQVAVQQPVTTFSVDVDRAAYSNARRFLNQGQLPPVDAVRIEEMINYFDYDYPAPTGEHPLSVTTEMTDSPWNAGLKLLHIGLQAKTVATKNLPASNLVFLIDVSGSMADENKLPLLKQAFKLLVDQLRAEDKISIVVYAGAAGEILPPTSGSAKMKIKEALDKLEAGGSTAGGDGIELAYKLAKDNFIKNGNNRVILATDGDFNVGISSEADLQRLVEEKRKDGIFLSVMGFGMGNFKDSNTETLADKGNGNYAYIDNIQEARKEFVQEFGGTLFTIAKDVKLQIEFNPRHVQAYRLIGYENRALKNEAFHDDKKDAGDMGSGHTVTALYEIIPAGAKSEYLTHNDALKYQKPDASDAGKTDEMLTLKIRYKAPDSDVSKLFDLAIHNTSKPISSCSENFRFASAVAEFGLLLRNSEFKGSANYANVIARAKGAFGKDEEGYRSEFVRLVKTAQSLDGSNQTARKD
ncbi:von Willebrand factor type A domain-containing protein [Dyadobacter sp. CY326]|uniref:YfbK domain-containing protein n=1 Tax=Dyadobacter sp. CY326 TaxID=2907300 RepID=UPI001F3503F1|nr:von Willebrand factor type A domain-containing protein [Dyadobacter sp. CY326]MCE7066083.1 von Willebrand factor type A domain-containing protein [Dyadobacter sp. CY326]